MLISRNSFFALLILLVLIPFLAPRIWWLAQAAQTNGQVSFTGKSHAGQFTHSYAVVQLRYRDSLYWFNGPDNLLLKEGTVIPVLFNPAHPDDARIDRFLAVWGDLLVYTGIFILLILIIFLLPDIFPRKHAILVKSSRPFIRLIPRAS